MLLSSREFVKQHLMHMLGTLFFIILPKKQVVSIVAGKLPFPAYIKYSCFVFSRALEFTPC